MRSPSRPVDLTDQVALEYLELLDTPRALAVWMLYAHREHQQLIALPTPLDVWSHTSIDHARRSYAATRLFAKSDFLDLGIDRAAVALATGRECEAINKSTNRRLRDVRDCRIHDYRLNSVLHAAARIVSYILGPVDVALRSIDEAKWTPGRSNAIRGPNLTPYWKYQASPDVSSGLSDAASRLLARNPRWVASAPRGSICDHATATTVPKNAKTDRLICYEPHINIYLQRPVGEWMRSRLLRVGIDLRSQYANQQRARLGSITGAYATIDLSCASDTLSTELVRDLVSPDWYTVLDKLRSRHTKWDKSSPAERNEKFSSMGNGFTFELETIVFYSICLAVMELDGDSSRDLLVYGDDIVVPTQHFESVCNALESCGFRINRQKSFGTGGFRESCGEDWYDGVSFRSPRLERRVRTVDDLECFHNRVFEWATVGSTPSCLTMTTRCDRTLRRWRSVLSRKLTSERVRRGPPGLGDGYFWCGFSSTCPDPASRRDPGWSGWRYYRSTVVAKRRLSPLDNFDAALCSALGPSQTSPTLVGGRGVRRVVASTCWSWPDVILV